MRQPSIAGLIACVFAMCLSKPHPVLAALPVGATAPQFTATSSLGGKQMPFDLADALKKGPVVLYFYPAAFTHGCTIEAHDFAEAMPDFAALHATVIGVSTDSIATLDRFSVSECRSKFPVASDASGDITKAYDARLFGLPGHANRTSYVIAPDGKVILSYTALDPDGHVGKALQAVKDWQSAHAKG